MRKYQSAKTVLLVVLLSPVIYAQQTCTKGIRVEGIVTDPTGAVVPGSRLSTSDGQTALTDETGRRRMQWW